MYQYPHYDHRGSLFEAEEGTSKTLEALYSAFGEELSREVIGQDPRFGYQGTAWMRLPVAVGRILNLSPTRIYLPGVGRFGETDFMDRLRLLQDSSDGNALLQWSASRIAWQQYLETASLHPEGAGAADVYRYAANAPSGIVDPFGGKQECCVKKITYEVAGPWFKGTRMSCGWRGKVEFWADLTEDSDPKCCKVHQYLAGFYRRTVRGNPAVELRARDETQELHNAVAVRYANPVAWEDTPGNYVPYTQVPARMFMHWVNIISDTCRGMRSVGWAWWRADVEWSGTASAGPGARGVIHPRRKVFEVLKVWPS